MKRNIVKAFAVVMAAGIAGTTTLSMPMITYALEAQEDNLIWDVSTNYIRLKAENGYKYGIRYVNNEGQYVWSWAEEAQYVVSKETGKLLYVEFSGLKSNTEYVFCKALVLDEADNYKLSVWTEKVPDETKKETESVTETKKETESETETEAVKETESETETESVKETESETETESVKETESETETESVKETESETEIETVKETESETETESVKETESETETESVKETESETETESVKETESETETESVKETESETETESVKETESETETESVKEAESENETEILQETEIMEELLVQEEISLMMFQDRVNGLNDNTSLMAANDMIHPDVETIEVVDFDESRITGVAEGVNYVSGTRLTATAVGAGMDIKNPAVNDERWVPRCWDWGQESFTDWNEPGYSTTFTLVNVGNYRITVDFEREVYTENGWQSTGVIQSKSVRFSVSEAPAAEYTITVSSESHGKVSPSGNVKVSKGESKTFTFTPDSGCKISKVYIDGYERVVSNNQYTFTQIDANHTIHVTFERANKLDTPKTGDVTQLMPAMALMCGSGSIMMGMLLNRRKDDDLL